MLFLHSVIVIITAGCFSTVRAKADRLSIRYINTTISTSTSSHSSESPSSVSTIQPLLDTGISEPPATTSLIVTNPVTTSSILSLSSPIIESKHVTGNGTLTQTPSSTTPSQETSTSVSNTSRRPIVTKSNHTTRNSTSTHTSFSTLPPQGNSTSVSGTLTSSKPTRCHNYRAFETTTSYVLISVTITDYGNSSAALFENRPVTLPPQPCSHEVYLTNPGPEKYQLTSTLKTTIIVSRSESVASWPSPSPADKITATPEPTGTTTLPSPEITTSPESTATITPPPSEIPSGLPIIPIKPVTSGEGIPNPVIASEAGPSGPDATDDPAQTSGLDMKGPKGDPASKTPEGRTDPSPTEVIVKGVTIALSPSSVKIGDQQFQGPANGPVTAGGQTFTINPSEIIGSQTTIPRPKIFQGALVPTTVAGISLAVGSSVAVIEGSTFDIGPGATPKTIQIGGQKISVGSDGMGFAQITLPPAPAPSHPITVGGLTVTAIGESEAVADGTTFKLPPGSATQTEVVKGQTLKFAASGIVLSSTTIGGPPNSGSTQVAVQGGLQITQIGSNSVVIEGTTFNVASGASPVTATIDGQKVSIGPNGIGIGSTTVHAPFALPTSVVTVGGVTIKESGSLAFIAGKTLTMGPKATATTTTVNGQTITIGPSGISIGTETLPIPPNPSATATFRAGAITFSEIGSTLAIIGGNTFTVGPEATPTEIVKNGQTLSIGPSGVAIGSTTIKAPFTPPPTLIITAAGVTFSEVGSTLAVIGGKTYTVDQHATPTTAILNEKTITINSNGLIIGTSTISAPFIPLETKVFTVGSLTISELGSTLAVLTGSTFTIGPNAPTITKVFNDQTVSLGPGGIGLASTTIPYLPTKVVTVGDITFSEIGSTLAVIEGTTFTVGPGAKTTTEVFSGQTVSLGPGGVGFKATTVMNSFKTSTSAATTLMTSAETTGVGSSTQTEAPSSPQGNGGGRVSVSWLWGAGVSLAIMWLL